MLSRLILPKGKKGGSILMNTKKGWFSKRFSLVPMLLTGESELRWPAVRISPEARQALRENRLKDAADILMKEYGLTCVEAGQLLDVSACADDRRQTRADSLHSHRAAGIF